MKINPRFGVIRRMAIQFISVLVLGGWLYALGILPAFFTLFGSRWGRIETADLETQASLALFF